MKFFKEDGALAFCHQGEMYRIEVLGKDFLRVRSTMIGKFRGSISPSF